MNRLIAGRKLQNNNRLTTVVGKHTFTKLKKKDQWDNCYKKYSHLGQKFTN